MLTGRNKKLCCMFLLALLFCTLFLPRFSTQASGADDILRLHVIANSDSAADQRVKLLVRDAILAQLSLLDSASRQQTEAYLLTHGKELLETIETTLSDNGFSYSAQLMLGEYAFPDRTYGEVTYPAGDYEALRVVLGTGNGQNWWCVLFPPLCIVTADGQGDIDTDEITFKSSILSFFERWREKH